MDKVSTPPNHDRKDFSDFSMDRCLSLDPVTKRIAIVGQFGSDNRDALILVEPAIMTIPDVLALTKDVHLELTLSNSIYASYTGTTAEKFQIQLTHPATEKHIEKYSKMSFRRVRETPEIYKEIVLPYIQSIPTDRNQWVLNILEGGCEAERVIFNDPDPLFGFILLPDIKWSASCNKDDIYVLAIARDASIRSLRDLNIEHLPLLMKMLGPGIEAIGEKYDLDVSMLRAYVHYHPSFYHFHVHIVHSSLTASCPVGRAHLLDDIVENLQIDPNYYLVQLRLCRHSENVRAKHPYVNCSEPIHNTVYARECEFVQATSWGSVLRRLSILQHRDQLNELLTNWATHWIGLRCSDVM